MRKKLFTSCLALSLFTLIISSNSNDVSVKAESADGYHVEEVIRDKFNKETLDSTWQLNGAKLEHYYNAFHCISPVGYGSGPFLTGAKLTPNGETRIEFTIYPQEIAGGANISFNIGMPGLNTTQSEPNVDCKVQLWDTQASWVVYQNNLALLQTDSTTLQPYGLNLYDKTTDVAIVVTNKSSQLTEVYVELSRDGEVVGTTESSPFKVTNPRYTDGYCGFFWDGMEIDMTNFRIYNDGVLAYEDNGISDDPNKLFTNSDVSFSTKDANTAHLVVTGLNETNCYYASVNSIKMNEANANIKNSYKLVEQENVSNPYELVYNLKINELNENSIVGFGYGLSEADTKIDAKNAIGFIKLDDKTAEVVAIRNGVIDRSYNYQVNFAKLGIGTGKYKEYSVSFDYAKHAYLTVNGLTFKFDNIDFIGQFATGLIDLGATKASNAELGEFSLNVNSYKKYDSIDMSNDFLGKKTSTDGFSYDPYVNGQKYFVGPQVAVEEDWATGETTVSFSNAGSYSAFGVRQKYSEFICEFDIEVFSRANFQYIGLSFAKDSVVDVLTTASNTNKSFLFRCDNSGEQTTQCLWGNGNLFANGTDSQLSPLNIYDKDNNKYHMLFVGKNRSLYVYYKPIDAPDSELGILRAYVPNINIDGFVSVVGTSGASFTLKNFKMVNLSDECNEESTLTLRETFENKNNISEKLSIIDGTINDGKLEMSNIQTVNQYLYSMFRFTTYDFDLENNLDITFSQGKKLIIDAKNSKMIVKEDGTETVYDCKGANLKAIKGKRFEVTIMGDTLKVGYKGMYDPADKMSTTLFTHTFASPLSRDNIYFYTNGKVTIDDLYLFALDNSMKCETFDYEDDPDNANTWVAKKDYDPSKVYKKQEGTNENGCKGSVAGSALALIGLLALLGLRKKED